jgi:hypothetical protein
MTVLDPTQPERIHKLQWELLNYLPYSLDLAPSDVHLFGPLKNHLGGKCFTDDNEVETEVRKCPRQQSKPLRCGFRNTGEAMGQVYQCWRRIW